MNFLKIKFVVCFHKLPAKSTSLLFVDKENLQSQEMENYAHYKEMKTRPISMQMISNRCGVCGASISSSISSSSSSYVILIKPRDKYFDVRAIR